MRISARQRRPEANLNDSWACPTVSPSDSLRLPVRVPRYEASAMTPEIRTDATQATTAHDSDRGSRRG